MRKFYEGGFDPEMTKREAALILGVRESAAKDKVLAAHRKVMIANHPDAGGSDYIPTKINEAKAKLIKKGGSGSPSPASLRSFLDGGTSRSHAPH